MFMHKGTLKSFDFAKGVGLVTPMSGGPEIVINREHLQPHGRSPMMISKDLARGGVQITYDLVAPNATQARWWHLSS